MPYILWRKWARLSVGFDTPVDLNQRLMNDHGELFIDLKRYRRLVGKHLPHNHET